MTWEPTKFYAGVINHSCSVI